MKKQLTRQSINSVCIGYSGNSHWEFFKMVLGKPWIKNICILGVYYGRDIAYMANILNSLGRDDYQIVGVDKFEDSYCDDWPEEQRNLTWEEAGFGPAPTLNKTKANLFELGLATNVFLVSDLDVNFFKNTQQKFDFIYLDTSHDYETVRKTIELSLARINPNGILGGDNFSDEGTWGVASAVRDSFTKYDVFFNWLWLAKPSDYQTQQKNSEVIFREIKNKPSLNSISKSILPQLLSAYSEEGYEVSVGLNPDRESANGCFGFLVESDLVSKLTKPDILPRFLTGGGIGLSEIYLLENVLRIFQPKREFLIGIAAGWSTIALGLINPSAYLYGIDNCTEGIDSQNGLELTKRIAEKFNLNLKICVGCSPEDVPSFLGKVLAVGGTIDFVFVDGLHTNEQVFRDFHACLPYLSDSAILAFHDILNWNMLSGWQNIVESGQKHNFKAVILRRTASGMGMLYRNVSKEVEENTFAFYQHPFLLCPT